MKIGVSSNVRFSEPLERCVASFLDSGFSADDVVAFVGGHGGYAEIGGPRGIRAFLAPHDSFDFTAMISVLDLGLENDWAFVHDTITVEPKFRVAVASCASCAAGEVYALTNDGPSMNMGVFPWKRLVSIRDDLERFRNASKTACVQFEDVFLRDARPLNTAARVVRGPEDVYGTGTPRVVEYYPDVGVHKYKSNWAVKDVYAVNP